MLSSRLETERLHLVAATAESMAAAAGQDVTTLGRLLGARIPEDWPPRIDGDEGRMAREGFAYVRDLLRKDPALVGWWGWFVILKGAAPVLVGAVSPKGPPDPAGSLEVAYGIVASHERRGYATEATRALIRWALKDARVREVVAETLPGLEASIAVMRKCGLTFRGEGAEPGTIRYGAAARDLGPGEAR